MRKRCTWRHANCSREVWAGALLRLRGITQPSGVLPGHSDGVIPLICEDALVQEKHLVDPDAQVLGDFPPQPSPQCVPFPRAVGRKLLEVLPRDVERRLGEAFHVPPPNLVEQPCEVGLGILPEFAIQKLIELNVNHGIEIDQPLRGVKNVEPFITSITVTPRSGRCRTVQGIGLATLGAISHNRLGRQDLHATK